MGCTYACTVQPIWVQYEMPVRLLICHLKLILAQVTPYAHDELVLIVPRHHELAKRGSIALEQLYTLPLVSLNQVHPTFFQACKDTLVATNSA